MANPVESRAVVAREVEAYLARHGARAAARIGLNVPADRSPDEGEMQRALRNHVVVYVTMRNHE